MANTQLSTSPSILLVLEMFFINVGLISDLNNRLLSRKSLKTITSNIWQKQHIMCRYRVLNLYKVIIDFNSSNAGSILANSSLGSISFANNKDNWENSILKTIYRNSNLISNTRTNIKCEPGKKYPQKLKNIGKLLKRNKLKLSKKRLESCKRQKKS